ncbi:MAG TPA: nucleotidyltransferase family protein [Candidatus Diapherotrites archaeon]|uniref:Nucleotidyltransferase family protein n=1 Tax=Candidatus Iainarchaeum sp. TaxID=3101447 RepID=A0A7J4JVW4_9ARCH|nr:nucleotidyltransferase family protein [Candidatus Diapherotrites archaeon]HIH32616.1 nucleotidyltransferase family protein [Candidatus Diapherotrites archaeon]
MAYTEVKERNGRKYYYRVVSVRLGSKVSKKREYLGANLFRRELLQKQSSADERLECKSRVRKKAVLEAVKPKIIEVLRKNKVKKAGIFGSFAHGKQEKNSDIDVLIQPAKGMSLLGFVKLKLLLESRLKRKIDLISYNGLNPRLKARILNEEVRIL